MDELLNIGRKLELGEVEPEVMIRESKPPGGEIDWGARAERNSKPSSSAQQGGGDGIRPAAVRSSSRPPISTRRGQ